VPPEAARSIAVIALRSVFSSSPDACSGARIAPAAIAASMSAVLPGARSPIAHLAWSYSCACIAPNAVTSATADSGFAGFVRVLADEPLSRDHSHVFDL